MYLLYLEAGPDSLLLVKKEETNIVLCSYLRHRCFLITDVSDVSTNISNDFLMNISELLEHILEKKLAFLQTFNCFCITFFYDYAKIERCG